jgi:hypothetical protein
MTNLWYAPTFPDHILRMPNATLPGVATLPLCSFATEAVVVPPEAENYRS